MLKGIVWQKEKNLQLLVTTEVVECEYFSLPEQVLLKATDW